MRGEHLARPGPPLGVWETLATRSPARQSPRGLQLLGCTLQTSYENVRLCDTNSQELQRTELFHETMHDLQDMALGAAEAEDYGFQTLQSGST